MSVSLNSLKKSFLPPEALADPKGYLQVLKNRAYQGLETAIGTGQYNVFQDKNDYGIFPWENSAKTHGVSDTNRSTPISEKIAYAGGRVGGTLASDNLRSWFWRYNHPLAIASSMGQEIPRSAGLTQTRKGADRIPAILAGFGLATALDLGTGNTDLFNFKEGGRPKGYSALLPEYDDPTKSQNLAIEVPLGYVTGRKGKLLPWEEFTLERPDISMEKYKEYKDYQSPNTPGLFGLEQANPLATAAAGAGLGALKAARNPNIPKASKGKSALIGAALGGIAGAAIPGAADLLSRMGIIKGTWSNLEGMPEAQLLGYKVDAKGALITAGAGAGIYAGSRYLANRKAANIQEIKALERQAELRRTRGINTTQLSDLDKQMRSLDPATRLAVEEGIYQENWKDYLENAPTEMTNRVMGDIARRKQRTSLTTSQADMDLVNKAVEDYRRRKGIKNPNPEPETPPS
jgi:hypothetical protein